MCACACVFFGKHAHVCVRCVQAEGGQVWRPVGSRCEHGSEVPSLPNPMIQGVSHLCVCTNMCVSLHACGAEALWIGSFHSIHFDRSLQGQHRCN